MSVIPGGDPIFSGETIVMNHGYLYTRLFTVNISLLDADGGGGNGDHRRNYTGLCSSRIALEKVLEVRALLTATWAQESCSL